MKTPLGMNWYVYVSVLLMLSFFSSCSHTPVAVTRERVASQAAKAEQAIEVLRTKLVARLTEAMGQGGPMKAIDVCSVEAQTLTGEIGRAEGLEIGRTSFRVRNPQNAPRAWAAATVVAAEGLKAANARPVQFDLGDRIGFLQPMPVGGMCVACHGSELQPEIAAAVRARYPTDRATGFAEGDLRGFLWVEVRKH